MLTRQRMLALSPGCVQEPRAVPVLVGRRVRASWRTSTSGRLGTVADVPWGLPREDLQCSIEAAEEDLRALRGGRLLVTGGTGFLGSWITSSLLGADRALRLGLRVTLVSRRPGRLSLPEDAGVEVLAADVRSLQHQGRFDFVLHGAASSSAVYGEGDGEPRAMSRTIVDGTQAVLEIASRSHARLLFLSSGAVYGHQVAPVGESASTGPDPLDPRLAYGQAKRLAETLCAAASAAGDLEAVVGRLFAFVGPRLPLDVHYAAGNFLAAALEGRALRVLGDGRPFRSYLYAGDLPEWCWALLVRGAPGRAYNVGSPEALSILELAQRISRLGGAELPVEVVGAPGGGAAPWYVPDTSRARDELGLRPRVGLEAALEKSYRWFAGQVATTSRQALLG